jgi:hypothetical protein
MTKKMLAENWYVTTNEKEQKLFREWTLGLLREREVNVSFIKADGSPREMTCTLNVDMLPPQKTHDSDSPMFVPKIRKVSEDAIRVFCTENKQWRSFRWDRVTAIAFALHEETHT